MAMQEQDVPLRVPPPLVAVVGATDDLAARLGTPRSACAMRACVSGRDGSRRKLGKQLESAAKAGAGWAVIVGDEGASAGVVLRDLAAGEQRELPLDQVAPAILPA